MKKKTMIIVAALIFAAGLLFYAFRSGPGQRLVKSKGSTDAIQSQPATEHQGHAVGEAQPQARTQAREEHPVAAPTIEIPLEKQQQIGVRIAEVAARPLQKIIRTVGRIEYDERRLATINAKFEGWIEKLYIDYTGRYVKKGEPLAEVYSPELIATQQELINLLKWTRQNKEIKDSVIGGMLSRDSESILDAARRRLKLWDITEAQITKIEETGKTLRTLTLYSPVNGYVVQKMAMQGMKVMPGEKLFDVADLSTLWIIADVYEYELSTVKPGESAKITISSFPGKEFSSRIDYIYPSISGATRTAKARFEIPNSGGRLKPQMYTNIEIRIDLGNKLAVPDDAVIDTGTRQIVYLDRGGGNFEPREVMLGISAEGFREVLMGLKAGERVAASGAFLIDSEAQLKNVTPLGGHKH